MIKISKLFSNNKIISKVFALSIILVLTFFLFGCSSSNQSTQNSTIISNIKAIDANTLEIIFSNGSSTKITDFTPKPLEEGKETEVTFNYNGNVYEEKVIYSDTFTGSIRKINTGFAKNGSISIVNSNTSNTMNISALSNNANEYAYISGQDGNGDAYMKEINNDSGEEKIVLFNSNKKPPAAYTSAFMIENNRYLLFAFGQEFSLYKHNKTDEENSHFVSSDLWDFSKINNYLSNLTYKGNPTGWVMSPEYNNSLKKLYFTLNKWVEDSTKGDYIKVRIFESSLNNGEFSTPKELEGEINPYNAIHYINGKEHSWSDFPGRMGGFWLGGMFITDDGTKAYFNALNISAYEDLNMLKPGDPYIAPTPNNQDFGNSGVTDIKDPRVIFTYILTADIDSTGQFYNIQKLSSSINRGGVNFVHDISPDGSKLYIGHMTLDDTFWSYGWGPDGMVRNLCEENPWDVEPWDGEIEEVIF
jgi:hypothetical protein